MNQLPATLEPTILQARALLDEGMTDAARLLADKAYHDAKHASAAAKRFGAASTLILRAHQLQGQALKIESQAKIRLADEYDLAQERGEASTGGRPKTVPDGNGFTAEEAGLSRKEIHFCRQLRDAERDNPGIIEQAIDARLKAKLEPTKASVARGIGTRSASKEERGDDFYETPACAVHTLLALEKFSSEILEPSCGKGAISRVLEAAGYEVELRDLIDRGATTRHGECASVEDFLSSKKGGCKKDIVTNPPFGIANQFIAHALREYRPAKMAMLLNLNFMCGYEDPDRVFVMEECPPARIYVFTKRLPMMHRDGYEGKKAGSQMNTAWFIWEKSRNGRYLKRNPELVRVYYPDHLPEGVADDESGVG